MKEYLNLIKDILNNGELHQNRTGINTRRIWGKSIKINLEEGFPLLTTKKMAIKSSFVEILGFIRGEVDIRWYQNNGCNIWNANHKYWHGEQKEKDKKTLYKLNKNDPYKIKLKESINYRDENPHSLGFIYGYQWRNFNGYDQLKFIYNALKDKSNSRRLLMSGWNPSQEHLMCLPPCHVLYNFSVRNDHLDISMTQRSVDCGLGLPFNLANTALICHIMAHASGLKPGIMCWFGNDVHIYENHFEQLSEQINRKPYELPKLIINTDKLKPWEINYNDLKIENYKHHKKISMNMAV
jgi:thymidylate synthase